jgi:hypothetical protein
MGIYSDGKIYGISIRLDVVVYQEIYENPITLEQIKEAKDFYDSIDSQGSVTVYIKCSSTYSLEPNSFMTWVPSSILIDRLISKE